MLAVALIIDALLGEPDWLWRRVRHPIVAFGWLVSALERLLNKGGMRRLKGALALVALLLIALVTSTLISLAPFGWALEILGGAVLLAHRSLVQHVSAVADALDTSIAEGRRAVAQIVGRDPDTLDASGVSRAAIESAAENFSDGVVAPAFWFVLGGLPGIAAYKMVNTADSMVGHLNERYREFGWASARLDDLMNWVPARFTGALLLAAGGRLDAVTYMRRDAPRHRSPNAGWPEAAMAHVLDISLAGPRVYGGRLTDDPFMNQGGRCNANTDDIRAAVLLLWRAWGALFGFAVALAATSIVF